MLWPSKSLGRSTEVERGPLLPGVAPENGMEEMLFGTACAERDLAREREGEATWPLKGRNLVEGKKWKGYVLYEYDILHTCYTYVIIHIWYNMYFFILALSLRFPFPKPSFGDSTLHDFWRKAPNGLFHKPILLSGLVRHVCSLYMFILTTWFLIWQVTLPPHMPNTGHGENLPCSISMHGSKQVLETLHWLVPCR